MAEIFVTHYGQRQSFVFKYRSMTEIMRLLHKARRVGFAHVWVDTLKGTYHLDKNGRIQRMDF